MDVLTSPERLTADLAGPRPPVLLDVRWRLVGPPGLADYRAGHVPGAVFVDLDTDLAGPPGPGGRHPMPAAAAFQAAMRRAGVRDAHPVVAYGDADPAAASRAWWMLRYFGHEQVAVLDGGYPGWLETGGRAESGDVLPAVPGDFTARPGQMPALDADGAAALARTGVLLDARAIERYRGESEPVDPVAGHIPGALSAPSAGNVDSRGRFLAPTQLRARFAVAGARRHGGPVGAYCGSGITAAQQVLALALAGIPAALYVGSWSDWIADPARPVASGPEPG